MVKQKKGPGRTVSKKSETGVHRKKKAKSTKSVAAGKKTKKRSGRSKKPGNAAKNFFKIAIGLSALIAIVVGVIFTVHFFLNERTQPVAEKYSVKKPAQKTAPKKRPVFEVFPKEEIIPSKPIPLQPPPPHKLPEIAIIIDDLGYNKGVARKFMTLGAPVTLSILPNGLYYKEIADEAHKKGIEIMLHLPMEPAEPHIDPGPEALLTSMPPNVLIDTLNKDIDAIPFIKGVNNHMGSKLTTHSDQMNQIFSILKKRDLYFVDSRTAMKTQCRSAARLLQVPFAERDVFLDNIQSPEAVRKQINILVHIAKEHGRAVGIGHPYDVTYDVLREVLPELKKKVSIVPASEVVRIDS